MGLVEVSEGGVGEEVVIGSEIKAGGVSPFNVLSFAAIGVPVVDQ
jgi:hypothetical protein